MIWTAFDTREIKKVVIDNREYLETAGFLVADLGDGPKQLCYGGELFLRFMNFIYYPRHYSTWTRDEILTACYLRRTCGTQLIDFQFNRRIAQTMNHAMLRNTTDVARRALDLGCGDGHFGRVLFDGVDATVVGIDADPFALTEYKSHYLYAVCGDIGSLPFGNATFDLSVAMFVFHFEAIWSCIFEVHRVLRDGGLLVVNYYGDHELDLIKRFDLAGLDMVAREEVCGETRAHCVMSLMRR